MEAKGPSSFWHHNILVVLLGADHEHSTSPTTSEAQSGEARSSLRRCFLCPLRRSYPCFDTQSSHGRSSASKTCQRVPRVRESGVVRLWHISTLVCPSQPRCCSSDLETRTSAETQQSRLGTQPRSAPVGHWLIPHLSLFRVCASTVTCSPFPRHINSVCTDLDQHVCIGHAGRTRQEFSCFCKERLQMDSSFESYEFLSWKALARPPR